MQGHLHFYDMVLSFLINILLRVGRVDLLLELVVDFFLQIVYRNQIWI